MVLVGIILKCCGSVLMFLKFVGWLVLWFRVLWMVLLNLVGKVVFSMIMVMFGVRCLCVILMLLVVWVFIVML